MTSKVFSRPFTQQEPISQEAIDAAVEVLKSGRLHRYNSIGEEFSEVSLLEQDFANFQGSRYCLACASGGYAMSVSLKAAGLKAGEKVLTNMYTLAPVPGSISNAGGEPIFIEINENLVLDLEDLSRKAISSKARFLLISHMRGHLVDMNKLMQIVEDNGLILIEDCAHTMGAKWGDKRSGNFGLAGCFSTQTYKHLNSGEGGLLTSNDAEFMARAIILSGSYMLYERHGAAPDKEVFADIRLQTPNYSGRMDNLRAAILRPQLKSLEKNIKRWNERYQLVEGSLKKIKGVELPERPIEESYVGSSIQFRLPGISKADAAKFLVINKERGVEIKWFGSDNPNGFTSNHKSWKYVKQQSLERSDEILSGLFDLRLPLTFSLEDCSLLSEIIGDCAEAFVSKK
ncbi:DegT/DnrJ/EryC1/StrS aminotransferase family protein [Candidatus Thioglobus sp.]|nr:DegT/DnrJ/EryC1/StrS aminotransferase family protein [Candidatus Thioglobus sp.]MDC1449343.1 DegT/DnrJ/EryC1/StrS aminotransferase family protein [Candidatus Thioglobus sp.]